MRVTTHVEWGENPPCHGVPPSVISKSPETWHLLDRHGIALCLHDKRGSSIAEPFVGPFVLHPSSRDERHVITEAIPARSSASGHIGSLSRRKLVGQSMPTSTTIPELSRSKTRRRCDPSPQTRPIRRAPVMPRARDGGVPVAEPRQQEEHDEPQTPCHWIRLHSRTRGVPWSAGSSATSIRRCSDRRVSSGRRGDSRGLHLEGS